MAVLASRLLAPPSLTRLQRELASDVRSLALFLFFFMALDWQRSFWFLWCRLREPLLKLCSKYQRERGAAVGMSVFLGIWIASVSVDDLWSWRVLLQGFLKVCLLISGSIMLYLVVDAQGIFSVQSDRIGKADVSVLPRGCGIMDHDAIAFGWLMIWSV